MGDRSKCLRDRIEEWFYPKAHEDGDRREEREKENESIQTVGHAGGVHRQEGMDSS